MAHSKPLAIQIQLLNSKAQVPQYAYPGDAGMDLRSVASLTLPPGERALVPTGIAIALPSGYAALVTPRSGLALKHGISVVNGPGLIDSNYRGELGVILLNTGSEPFYIEEGMRIAQLLVIEVPEISFVQSETLPESPRNAQGFGSSGV